MTEDRSNDRSDDSLTRLTFSDMILSLITGVSLFLVLLLIPYFVGVVTPYGARFRTLLSITQISVPFLIICIVLLAMRAWTSS